MNESFFQKIIKWLYVAEHNILYYYVPCNA